MQQLVTALARHALPELVATEPRESGIHSWFEGGSFQIDAASSADRIQFKNISVTEFTSFQIFDFARFALSSLETMASCKSDPARRRAIGWPLLKAYYAGFFGGHAIMRATGRAVVRIEVSQTNKISQIGRLFCGPSFSVSSGTFELTIVQNPDLSIDADLSRMDESGGAHSIFWRRFNSFLDHTALQTNQDNEPEAALIIAKLQELKTLLTSRGAFAGTWLSAVRNKINYQHQFGVWFPFGAAEADVRQVSRFGYHNTDTTRLDFDTNKEILRAFSAGSLFVAALSADLAGRLVEQSTNRRARFVRNWERLRIELEPALTP